jgi:hypothetical protein
MGVMSIDAAETREAKEKWLLRPINWAGHVALYALVLMIGVWTDASAEFWSPHAIAILATVSLVVIQGLIIWGIRRILGVTRGLR